MALTINILAVCCKEEFLNLLDRKLVAAGFSPTVENFDSVRAVTASCLLREWDVMVVNLDQIPFFLSEILLELRTRGILIPIIGLTEHPHQFSSVETGHAELFVPVKGGDQAHLVSAILHCMDRSRPGWRKYYANQPGSDSTPQVPPYPRQPDASAYADKRVMAAMDSMASGISHNLNNMLQSILGYVELARCGVNPGDQAHQDLEQARRMVMRAAQFTHELGLTSGIHAISGTKTDINRLVMGTVQQLQREVSAHRRIHFQPQQDLPKVNADAGLLRLALSEVCKNAIDSLSQQGELTLETMRREMDQSQLPSYDWITPGSFAVISVKDTGHGIKPEDLQLIYDPFFSTRGEKHVSGLGLTQVNSILRRHNGYVAVESEPGKGTVVSLYLPAAEITQAGKTKSADISGGD